MCTTETDSGGCRCWSADTVGHEETVRHEGTLFEFRSLVLVRFATKKNDELHISSSPKLLSTDLQGLRSGWDYFRAEGRSQSLRAEVLAVNIFSASDSWLGDSQVIPYKQSREEKGVNDAGLFRTFLLSDYPAVV